MRQSFAAALMAALVIATPAGARVRDPLVVRSAAGKLDVRWQAAGPVDVYVADRAETPLSAARLVSGADADGRAEVATAPYARVYVLLRDRADRSVVEAAERLLPLQQGSNFRDVGGYPAAGGKTVRWGLIYRSGASPMLTDADLAQVRALALRNLVDLRSDEERQLAPTKIDQVAYNAWGYSMAAMMPAGTPLKNGGALYRNFPTFFAPQLRILFGILKRKEGPVAYNCSAGQDRTGFATAMVLSALGVPRATIRQDYDISTALRQPQYELPKIDPALYPANPVAQMFARFQSGPRANVAEPLHEADGSLFLDAAFDEIERKWGSVDAYLEKEVGLTKADIAVLRRTYLQ